MFGTKYSECCHTRSNVRFMPYLGFTGFAQYERSSLNGLPLSPTAGVRLQYAEVLNEFGK